MVAKAMSAASAANCLGNRQRVFAKPLRSSDTERERIGALLDRIQEIADALEMLLQRFELEDDDLGDFDDE